MPALSIARPVREAFVHYGSLAVARGARPAFDQAVAYLERDHVERSLIERLEHAPKPVRLVVNNRNNDSFDPATRTIHWDPRSALETTCGQRQSPALGLGHEIDHAVHDGPAEWRREQTADRNFDTAEERRVITGSERHAAQVLGEGVRHDHAGTSYRVQTPVAMPLHFVSGPATLERAR